MTIKQRHPHSNAIDRVGKKKVREHFGLTAAALYNWRHRGIPPQLHRPFMVLAALNKVHVPEIVIETEIADRQHQLA